MTCWPLDATLTACRWIYDSFKTFYGIGAKTKK